MWLSANALKGDGIFRWEYADGYTQDISDETSNWKWKPAKNTRSYCVRVENGDKWVNMYCTHNSYILCQIPNPEMNKGMLNVLTSKKWLDCVTAAR